MEITSKKLEFLPIRPMLMLYYNQIKKYNEKLILSRLISECFYQLNNKKVKLHTARKGRVSVFKRQWHNASKHNVKPCI